MTDEKKDPSAKEQMEAMKAAMGPATEALKTLLHLEASLQKQVAEAKRLYKQSKGAGTLSLGEVTAFMDATLKYVTCSHQLLTGLASAASNQAEDAKDRVAILARVLDDKNVISKDELQKEFDAFRDEKKKRMEELVQAQAEASFDESVGALKRTGLFVPKKNG